VSLLTKEASVPSVSEKQRRFFGAELARKRLGKRTRTGLSTKVIREFASSVEKGFFTHMDASAIKRPSIMGGQTGRGR